MCLDLQVDNAPKKDGTVSGPKAENENQSSDTLVQGPEVAESANEKPMYEEGLAVWAKMKVKKDWASSCPAKITSVQSDEKGVKYEVSFFGWNQSAWLSSGNVRPYQGNA